MIELFEKDVKLFERQSSKGNQLKWEKDGIWYKADYSGYEGLSEYMISQLLKKTSLGREEFVEYDLEQIKYKRQILLGVKSRDFLKDDWQIITLHRLYKSNYNRNLLEDVWKYPETKDRIKYLVEQVERLTGLKDFGVYMCKLLAIDAFFLNEDRHMHNIAVLMNGDGKYKLCPVFDQGAGLLSDTTLDYPMGEDPILMMGEAKAKTICQSFDEALDVTEELYGNQLKFFFNKKDVRKLIDGIEVYTKEEKNRVETIIYEQMRKYQYLMR